MYITAENNLTVMGLTFALLCHRENYWPKTSLSLLQTDQQSCEVQVRSTCLSLGSTTVLQESAFSIS